MFEYLQIN